MKFAPWLLLAAALAYPPAGLGLLFARVSLELHLLLWDFLAPLCVTSFVLMAKGWGARLSWPGLAAFVVWVGAWACAFAYIISMASASC